MEVSSAAPVLRMLHGRFARFEQCSSPLDDRFLQAPCVRSIPTPYPAGKFSWQASENARCTDIRIARLFFFFSRTVLGLAAIIWHQCLGHKPTRPKFRSGHKKKNLSQRIRRTGLSGHPGLVYYCLRSEAKKAAIPKMLFSHALPHRRRRSDRPWEAIPHTPAPLLQGRPRTLALIAVDMDTIGLGSSVAGPYVSTIRDSLSGALGYEETSLKTLITSCIAHFC